ncbi:MAG: mandelate racemase/muconate lactonizing enzyme family protein [Dehalococcoidia bacterium]
MKITDIRAYPIRVSRSDVDKGSSSHGKEDRPPVVDYGDYFIDKTAFTSVYSKFHETTVVRLQTENGLVGWGEAQSPVSPRTTKTIVEDLVRPLVMGRDAFDIEAIWTRAYGAMRERGHPTGFYVDALAGLDVALWDVVGKAVGKPIHKLAGGRYRDRIRLYAGLGGTDPALVAEEAAEHVAAGYQSLKLHLLVDRDGVADIVAAVRDRVGPSVELMVDVHMRHSVVGAIELGRRLEALDVRWLESPTVPEDIQGQAEIARALDMAVAIGEWSRTRYEMRESFERRAFDVVMPDIARTGITEGKRIATLADTYNIPVSPHVGGGGILSVAATVEFSAATPNFLIMEHSHKANAVKNAITVKPYDPVNGEFVLTDTPGLGVEIDEARLEEFAFPG